MKLPFLRSVRGASCLPYGQFGNLLTLRLLNYNLDSLNINSYRMAELVLMILTVSGTSSNEAFKTYIDAILIFLAMTYCIFKALRTFILVNITVFYIQLNIRLV